MLGSMMTFPLHQQVDTVIDPGAWNLPLAETLDHSPN